METFLGKKMDEKGRKSFEGGITVGVKVKICGLTTVNEAQMLIEEKADFGGVVLFYEKSKRNCSPKQATEITAALRQAGIKSVAVTVSPTLGQIEEIEKAGFDYLQVHGELREEVLQSGTLPIIRAFNISNMKEREILEKEKRIAGWLFDAAVPGAGKTFDWSLLKEIERDGKLRFLAGGLTADNVSEAVKQVKPDIVDVSSGVEFESAEEIERMGFRKNPEKVKQFIRNAKNRVTEKGV